MHQEQFPRDRSSADSDVAGAVTVEATFSNLFRSAARRVASFCIEVMCAPTRDKGGASMARFLHTELRHIGGHALPVDVEKFSIAPRSVSLRVSAGATS